MAVFAQIDTIPAHDQIFQPYNGCKSSNTRCPRLELAICLARKSECVSPARQNLPHARQFWIAGNRSHSRSACLAAPGSYWIVFFKLHRGYAVSVARSRGDRFRTSSGRIEARGQPRH